MMYKQKPYGVTLIELLIALTIIMMIVTAVYSTYFVTADSVNKCREKLTQAQQGRSLLEKMSRQLRSIYSQPLESMVSPKNDTIEIEPSAKTLVSFRADPDDPEGIMLRMLTSVNLFPDKDRPGGIWHVQYKFLPQQETLLYCQQPVALQPEQDNAEENWLPLTENLTAMQMQFFDGEKWLPKWDADNKQIPEAIRIEITLRSDQTQAANFQTSTSITTRSRTHEKGMDRTG
jgi:general secretion pathway protein J